MVLWSTTFLIFVNDIYKRVDDLKILVIKSEIDCYSLQNHININNLEANIKKCLAINFHRSKRRIRCY